MDKSIDEVLQQKPTRRLCIYAYSIDDSAHAGQLKIGQTTRDVRQRVREQVRTANIKNFTIELEEAAERSDGTMITDNQVRAALVRKGFERVELEWMRCSVKDVRAAIISLRAGEQFAGSRDQAFTMRDEQRDAVEKTHRYFHSIWSEDIQDRKSVV